MAQSAWPIISQSKLPWMAYFDHCLKARTLPPSRTLLNSQPCVHGASLLAQWLSWLPAPYFLPQDSQKELKPRYQSRVQSMSHMLYSNSSDNPQRRTLTRQVSADPISPWRLESHHLHLLAHLMYPNSAMTP